MNQTINGPINDGIPINWMNAEAWDKTCHIC
jgi:hypothetical protein